MIPQLIYIILSILTLGLHLAKHGEELDLKYNFIKKGINIAIVWFILYKGGFWDCFINV